MAFKILICDEIHPICQETFQREPDFEVDRRSGLKAEQLQDIIEQYDGLIARSSTDVTAQVIHAAERLKVVGRTGVGVDNVDVKAATEKGILVMNTPDVNTVATAEHTLALLFALVRKIPQADLSVKRGEWRRESFKGLELAGKTLGIIGLGRVGRAVALRAEAFGMTVMAFDPLLDQRDISGLKVQLMNFTEVLTKADFITLHVPLNDETRSMIDDSQLDRCKEGVCIINCSRGGVVNESALWKALERGKVSGAALDVFENEPPSQSGLLKCKSVILTPHVAGQTIETSEKAARAIAVQIMDYLKRGIIRNVVNAP